MLVVSDKVVVVFGGNGGIGKCTVLELLNQGVKGILIVDQNDTNIDSFIQNEIASSYGRNKAKFMKCNVTDQTEVQGVFDFCIQQFACLDIVINLVGIVQEKNSAAAVAVNLVGAMHVINEAYARLSKCKSPTTEQAVICSVASSAGLFPLVNFPNYSATKSGLITFAYCMGKNKEMEGNQSVKIVTLCPTATETSFLDTARDMCKTTTGVVQQELIRIFQDNNTVQKPESVAKCIIDIVENGDNASIWLAHMNRRAERVDYDAIQNVVLKIIAN